MKRRLLFIILYLYTLVFSVSKTIRLPNNWAEAHWMLDYRFGFVKRGLAGEIFGFFLEKTEQNVFLLSVVILVILYGSLLSIAYRETIRNKEMIYTIIFYVIFFLSQYIIFSAHLIGYLDHVIFLLTIFAIWLLKHRKILLASLVVSISILIHEVSFLLMLPICCFTLIINETKDNEFSIKDIVAPEFLKRIAIFLLFPLIITLGVSRYQEILGTNYHSQIFTYLKSFKFINEKSADSVASAYTVKFTDYFTEESPHFFQRIFVSKGSVFFGIPILFMMYLVYKQFRKVNIYILLLLAVVTLTPLCLHAIAYDTYRIWSFPFMILFLGFWILSSKLSIKYDNNYKLSVIEIVFAIISITFTSLVPSYLLDHEIERFSLMQRLIILLPLFIVSAYYYRKAPIKIY